MPTYRDALPMPTSERTLRLKRIVYLIAAVMQLCFRHGRIVNDGKGKREEVAVADVKRAFLLELEPK